MVKINQILKSLEKASTTNIEEIEQQLAVRFIDSRAVVPLFLGLNQASGVRYLFIHLKEKLPTQTLVNLPTWNGMNIEQVKTSISLASIHNEWFLVLHHQNESDYKIFESVIENICIDLLSIEKNEGMITKLQRNLERWKYFFSVHGREGLSQEAQQGLYGELWVLRELLQNNHNSNIIDTWIGPENEANDFQKSGVALEVKTLTTKKHYKVSINNEKQLNDNGLRALFLVTVVLRKIDSGETLPEIITSIRRKLGDNVYSIKMFEEKLFQVGYLGNHSYLYNKGYVFEELLSYQVSEGFPRVLTNELQQGVGDIKYSIQLAACESYKVDFKDVLYVYTQDEGG
ncbi:PD-(D/E)XK motif protein [Gracilibacillus suaedae]|uniref:PD-(D/E)XK motif protein n=1 Tax=Gracilibacillus suaedae TaxID=2820273 RepID=UPI001ABEAF86|nr:PD-(D/E)XK motif protein [Gracilibacillus suaedae]